MGQILLDNVSKRFRKYNPDRPWTLQEAVLGGFGKLRKADVFWALQDINLVIEKGHTVGVIGRNGAGKSTLMRLIGGVLRPDRGSLKVAGRVSGLLELGAGFHGDLTGRQNVYVNGVIAGLTRKEVAERFASIVEFAELGSFIDSPLRTYSSGMQMRLAFAVASHVDPDVLIIDEVLAVGDVAFQRKCLKRIEKFRNAGTTIVLVSHDNQLVSELCEQAIWLRAGQVAGVGGAKAVVSQYASHFVSETRARTPSEVRPLEVANGVSLEINKNRFGSLEVEIKGLRMRGPQGQPASELERGDALLIEIEYLAVEPVEQPIFGLTITSCDGRVWRQITSENIELVDLLQGSGRISVQIDRLDLDIGSYYLDAGVYERNWNYSYDFHWHVYSLKIHPSRNTRLRELSTPVHPRWFFDPEYP